MASCLRRKLSTPCAPLSSVKCRAYRYPHLSLGRDRMQEGHATSPGFPARVDICIPTSINFCLINCIDCFFWTQNLCSKQTTQVQCAAFLTLPTCFLTQASFFLFSPPIHIHQITYSTSYMTVVFSFVAFINLHGLISTYAMHGSFWPEVWSLGPWVED